MIRRALAAAALILAGAAAAVADEVRVFAAGATMAALEDVAPVFEQRTGHRLRANFDTVGALRDRVLAGENPDVVLLSAPALDALATAGRLAAGTRRDLGRTGVGLAAPLGAPPLDISTPDRLRAVLLAAPSLAYADPARGATAGTHFRKVLAELGIADAVAAHAKVVPFGVDGVRAVAEGEFALAVSMATEILANRRVRFVGNLPEPLQLWTVYGAAAVAPASGATGATAALLEFLAGETATEAFRRIGFAR
ncbi:MAG: substrate-binding domain-containing protein [Alphaproteobacteria bacterium]|nr:substrate-binding domain-containing protein [Alphaproteobacteria bacterium]